MANHRKAEVTSAPSLLQTKVQRASSDEEFSVYKAALEWSLFDPIVIEGRDDFKSEYRWKDRLEPSMSRRGNCWDNAVAESFFASLKKARIEKRIYVNRMSAIEDVRDYIDSFYNPIRRNRHLGGVSPDVFEANAKRA